MKGVEMGPWEPALEEDSFEAESFAFHRKVFEAWRRSDVEWILEHCDPELVVRQPAEFTDAQSYRGREGFLDAVLDWPTQWDDFGFDPRRIFAVGPDHVVVAAVHRGRARQIGVEVEGEVVWLFEWRERQLVKWDMFMALDDALAAAGVT